MWGDEMIETTRPKFWVTEESDPELTPQEKALRDAFVAQYLLDYNPVKAAIRIGYKASIAGTYAARFMDESYVLRKIAELERGDEDIARVIKSGLVREANYNGPGASHGARVAAITQLSKIEKLDMSNQPAIADNQSSLRLTASDLKKLSDDDIDHLLRIFQTINVPMMTIPEPVAVAGYR